jgi:hypothetical protein
VAIVAGIVVAGGFLAGYAAARRFVPPLAPTREGRLAWWIVMVLAGASVGVVVDQVWMGIRSLTEIDGGDLQPHLREQIVTSTLGSVLLQGGALLALSAIIYLLAPTDPAEPH